jgi:hypothetical protein
MIAFTPWNLFGDDIVLWTSYATLPIRKEDRNVPKRNKLPSARLLGGIVGGTTPTALRTNSSAVFAVMEFGNNTSAGHCIFRPNFSKNKGLVIRNGIEYSFKEHLGGEKQNESCGRPTFYPFSDRGGVHKYPVAHLGEIDKIDILVFPHP